MAPTNYMTFKVVRLLYWSCYTTSYDGVSWSCCDLNITWVIGNRGSHITRHFTIKNPRQTKWIMVLRAGWAADPKVQNIDSAGGLTGLSARTQDWVTGQTWQSRWVAGGDSLINPGLERQVKVEGMSRQAYWGVAITDGRLAGTGTLKRNRGQVSAGRNTRQRSKPVGLRACTTLGDGTI